MNILTFKKSTLGIIITIFIVLSISYINKNNTKDVSSTKSGNNKLKNQTLKTFQNVSVYIDNTASMYNYEKGTDNTFRSDINKIFDIINSAQDDEPKWHFNVVNTTIHKLDIGLEYFRRGNNIFTNKLKIGEITKTDYEKIFDYILNDTIKNELSVFITDLLYDTKDLSNNGAESVAASFESLARNKFKELSKNNKSVIIIKLLANYKGDYYPNFSYNNKNLSKININQKRPYYILLIGKTKFINTLVKSKKFGNWEYMKNELLGFDNYFSFFNPKVFNKNIYYTALTYSLQPVILYFSKNDLKNKKQIKNLYFKHTGGKSAFYLGIDFSYIPLFDYYLYNTNNYYVKPEKYISLVDIKNIKNITLANLDKNHIQTCNTMLKIQLKKIDEMNIQICLNANIPDWIERTDSKQDGLNHEVGETTTFAFGSFIKGIKDAYKFDGNIFSAEIRIINN